MNPTNDSSYATFTVVGSLLTYVPLAEPSLNFACMANAELHIAYAEAAIIMTSLAEKRDGNLPEVVMWQESPAMLRTYARLACKEVERRGGGKNLFLPIDRTYRDAFHPQLLYLPWWWRSRELHASHRSLLIRRNPDYYQSLWPLDNGDLPLVWPGTEPGRFTVEHDLAR